MTAKTSQKGRLISLCGSAIELVEKRDKGQVATLLDALQAFKEDESSQVVLTKSAIQDTFKVVVDYGQSLAEMISAGKYDWVNSDITQKRFPVKGSDQKEMELALFHFGRVMASEQVIAEMDKLGYRPAKIEELLALGATYPELRKKFSILAFGSVGQDPRGDWRAPCLGCLDAERRRGLGFRLLIAVCGEDYRFAAARK